MKYTIHGFSQKTAIEMNLKSDDLLLLRWFVDFVGTNRMKNFFVEDECFYWVKYDAILGDLPILDCKKRAVSLKFKNLVDADVLKHQTLKRGGTYSVYTFGAKYESLVVEMAGGSRSNDNGIDAEIGGCSSNDNGIDAETEGFGSNSNQVDVEIANLSPDNSILAVEMAEGSRSNDQGVAVETTTGGRSNDQGVVVQTTYKDLITINPSINPSIKPSKEKKGCACVEKIYTPEQEIFDYWNSKTGVLKNQEDSFDQNKISTAVKKYGKEIILKAIDRLNEAVLAVNYYYEFRWNLYKFLKQSNGISNWLDDGQIWNDYNSRGKGESKQPAIKKTSWNSYEQRDSNYYDEYAKLESKRGYGDYDPDELEKYKQQRKGGQ